MKDLDITIQLAWTFMTVALFSMGGANSLIPEFHRQIVDFQGWMSGSEFAQLVAIAQIAPGPNMLVVSLIGWKVAGPAGLAAATAGLVAPTATLAFITGRRLARWGDAPALVLAKRATAPIVVGLMAAAGVVIARAANHNYFDVAITAAAAVFIFFTGRSPLWVVAGGAAAGLSFWQTGLVDIR